MFLSNLGPMELYLNIKGLHKKLYRINKRRVPVYVKHVGQCADLDDNQRICI